MSEIQFRIDLDIDMDFPGNEKAAREYVAKLLQDTAQSVLKGGTQENCGASHLHESGGIHDSNKGFVGSWVLQIDE